MAKRGLGRGIDALLQGRDLEIMDRLSPVETVPLSQLVANPDQPRKQFANDSLQELAASIREKGIIQPILVQPQPNGVYRIIAGERRYRAAQMAGLTEVPVLSRDYSDEEVLEIALIENIQREDLNPIEEAVAFRHLIETYQLSQDELAQRIGKSRPAIANSLRLLKLPQIVTTAIAAGELSAGHARQVLSLDSDDEGLIIAFVNAITKHALSVRVAEDFAKKLNQGLQLSDLITEQTADAPRKTKRPTATPTPGSPEVAKRPRDPNLTSIERALFDRFGTKVEVRPDEKANGQSGTIRLNYYSLDDLNRLYDLLLQSEDLPH